MTNDRHKNRIKVIHNSILQSSFRSDFKIVVYPNIKTTDLDVIVETVTYFLEVITNVWDTKSKIRLYSHSFLQQ